MSKTLGVLGGMGPAATVDFLAKLQAATPAACDQDHIRVIADINGKIPPRLTEPAAAEAALRAMAAGLRDGGAEVLAMPCNTAHVHAAAIREASGLPLIDMIGEAIAAARATGVETVGLLATPVASRLYAERLSDAGLTPVELDEAERAAFAAVIARIKIGDVGPQSRAGMRRLAGQLTARRAGLIIAGCSEVPLVLGSEDLDVPLLDATRVLADACVAACR